MSKEKTSQLNFEINPEMGPVECLGMTFPNEEARRAYFTGILRKKLKDPEFRKLEGFPKGEDEDILAMSDAPYYTACPNPFIEDFLSRIQIGNSFGGDYHCPPFAADVSEGKTDGLYTAHSYHTKVPHKAIVRYAVHYTKPGDVILDGFCGSGMTGVAAQMCGCPDAEFRGEVEAERKAAGYPAPQWGERRVILSDLSPVATFISANYNLPIDVNTFRGLGQKLLSDLWKRIGSMYETTHPNSQTKVRINFTIWSEVFNCPHCGGEIVFLEEAFDKESKKVRNEFSCPSCRAIVTKRSIERVLETQYDGLVGKGVSFTKRKPVVINYSVGKVQHEKTPDVEDLMILAKSQATVNDRWFPATRMMLAPESTTRWGDKWRFGTANFTHIHHLFMPRPLHALSHLWDLAEEIPTARERLFGKFFVEQAIWGLSILNRYGPTHYSQVNRCMSGSYYIPAQFSECSPWYNLGGKLERLLRDFVRCRWSGKGAFVSTGSCTQLPVPDGSIDYIFTDPPFGDNLAYAELNFLVEAWHRVFTNISSEAIMSCAQNKSLSEYQDLMRRSFKEYYRVLKRGHWMTVVFHNSQNTVWNAIQEAIRSAGFVIADVRTLDKKQGSFNQVLASDAVKQDLTISAYKPIAEVEDSIPSEFDRSGLWGFVFSHLRQLPVFIETNGSALVVVERQDFVLFDRMVAFYVQRGLSVPISASEFYAGLRQRFPERNSMYFLPEQVNEYDLKRLECKSIEQYQLFVCDEKTAIQWVRRQLTVKPMSYSELQPLYMQEAQRVWGRFEQPVELRMILEQNFIEENRFWRVADPRKESDLEDLRHRALMREFQKYTETKGKLKILRSEALRAGFKDAWQKKDYTTIVSMAKRVPDALIQEDEALLMYFDNASLMLGK